jgi:hypothetical protein
VSRLSSKVFDICTALSHSGKSVVGKVLLNSQEFSPFLPQSNTCTAQICYKYCPICSKYCPNMLQVLPKTDNSFNNVT